MRILLIETDGVIADALIGALDDQGHQVTRCVPEIDALVARHHVDLVVLGLGRPETEQLEFVHEVRRASTVPILLLPTSNGLSQTSPYQHRSVSVRPRASIAPPRTLLAATAAMDRAIARHNATVDSIVKIEDIAIDLGAHRVRVADEYIALTGKEFAVLAVLAPHVGTAVSRQQIINEVWGRMHLNASQSLTIHIANLRAKLNRPTLLRTIRGFGYRLG